jgi:hypothetical protein
MHPEIYVYLPPCKEGELIDVVPESINFEKIVCSKNNQHQRAGRRLTPLVLNKQSVSVMRDRDIAWTWGSDCLLSERALQILRKSGVTGFVAQETLVSGDDNESTLVSSQFFELQVVGWGGIAKISSGIELIEHCDCCDLLNYSGFHDASKILDPKQWDGSDVFFVWPMPKYIFLTSRAVQAFRDLGADERQIAPLNELQSVKQLTPGRLSYWLTMEKINTLCNSLEDEKFQMII